MGIDRKKPFLRFTKRECWALLQQPSKLDNQEVNIDRTQLRIAIAK